MRRVKISKLNTISIQNHYSAKSLLTSGFLSDISKLFLSRRLNNDYYYSEITLYMAIATYPITTHTDINSPIVIIPKLIK